MPNLLVTQKCVRRCPYCFADSYMAGSQGDFLRWDDFIYVLDFYERSRVPIVSFLGGEPGIHPQVAQMMDYAMMRGFDFRMFTSGILPAATRERIQEVRLRHEKAGRKVTFIVNVNHPDDTPEAQRRIQDEFLAMGGAQASISFNVYRTDFDLDFAFDLIERHGLMPNLRLGLTHPIAKGGEGNVFVPPHDYPAVSARLEKWFPRFAKGRVIPGFDCGFPICMFTDAQLGALTRLQATFHWTCGPIVDIGPDLELWPCFPLSHIRGKTLYDFDSLDEVMKYFVDEVKRQRPEGRGIYPECDGCEHRQRGLCSGGCAAYALGEVGP